jgi:hypothetical protein
MNRRHVLLVVALAILAVVVALPALAADPSAPPGPGKSDKAKASKVPETPVSLTGTVAASTDAEGNTQYTLQSGGTTYTLEAGPSWFFGDKHPLKAFVGKSVTVAGEKKEGSNEVDVKSVDGTVIRGEGKPPWAGGWKRVGSIHPGWSQEKADRFKAKFGDCFPPGQCKKTKSTTPAPAETPGIG